MQEPYRHPRHTKKKHWHILLLDPLLKKELTPTPSLILRRAKTLKNLRALSHVQQRTLLVTKNKNHQDATDAITLNVSAARQSLIKLIQ